jgi:hypothetical protein
MKISAEQETRLFDIINLSQGPAFSYADFVVSADMTLVSPCNDSLSTVILPPLLPTQPNLLVPQVFVNDPNTQDLVWKLRRSLARSKVPENEILGALLSQDSNGSGFVSSKQFAKVGLRSGI